MQIELFSLSISKVSIFKSNSVVLYIVNRNIKILSITQIYLSIICYIVTVLLDRVTKKM